MHDEVRAGLKTTLQHCHAGNQSDTPRIHAVYMRATNQEDTACSQPGRGRPGSLVRARLDPSDQPIRPLSVRFGKVKGLALLQFFYVVVGLKSSESLFQPLI